MEAHLYSRLISVLVIFLHVPRLPVRSLNANVVRVKPVWNAVRRRRDVTMNAVCVLFID